MEKITYTGKFFQVLNRIEKKCFEVSGKKVEKEIQYELVRRSPGVRALISSGNRILINREYRYELDAWDYRLPGGKVFDSMEEYADALEEGRIQDAIEARLKQEMLEEADIQIKDFRLMEISRCGFTVEWDLYYFFIDIFQILPTFYDDNAEKNEYEYIEHCWMEYSEVYKLCLEGKISEKSSAFIVLKYLLENNMDKIIETQVREAK